MQMAFICGRCAKVHAEADDATLVIDFFKKQISFICQNKQCKHDNIFDFGNFAEQSKKSPLPKMRTL